MSTFQVWLTEQETRAENDPVGWLARVWKRFEGDRPKLSSPTSIKRFIAEHGSQTADWQGYLDQAAQAATKAYHAHRNAEPKGDTHDPAARAAAAAGTPLDQAVSDAMQATDPAGGTTWAVEPAQRLGKCLKCDALMGVALVSGEKKLACANGHVLGGPKPQSPSAATEIDPDMAEDLEAETAPAAGQTSRQRPDGSYDVWDGKTWHWVGWWNGEKWVGHPSAAAESDETIRGLSAAGEVMEIRSDGELARANVAQYEQDQLVVGLDMRLAAVETMQGLIVQMLAAASPAAAGVLMEHVNAAEPAAGRTGPPEALLSELLAETPASFEGPAGRWEGPAAPQIEHTPEFRETLAQAGRDIAQWSEQPPVTFGHKANCPSRNGGRCTCDDVPQSFEAWMGLAGDGDG